MPSAADYGIELQRNPQGRGRRGEAKALRHDAHDFATDAVQLEPAPDDLAVTGESAAPHAFADEHHRRRARAVVRIGERAADQRQHLQNGDERRRNSRVDHPLRRRPPAPRIGHVHLAFQVHTDTFDRVREPLIGEVRRRGLRLMQQRQPRQVVRCGNEPLWIPERKRAKQDAVDQREDRDARSDSDGERQDSGDRERGDRRSERAARRKSCAVASSQSVRSSRRRLCRSTAVSSRRDALRSPNSSRHTAARSLQSGPLPSIPPLGSRCGTPARRPRRARCGRRDCEAHAAVRERPAHGALPIPPRGCVQNPEQPLGISRQP